MALTGDHEPSASGWVRERVEQMVRTGTTDGVTISGLPTVLMTYRGAKTGKVRKTPVMRVEHEGHYAAVASKGGAPTNPQWYAPHPWCIAPPPNKSHRAFACTSPRTCARDSPRSRQSPRFLARSLADTR